MKTLNALKRAALTARDLTDDDGGDGTPARVLVAVRDFHATNGYAPSLTDLSVALAWPRERTRQHVRALLESGHLTQRPGVSRSLRVASDAERLGARVAAWYAAFKDLPSVEVAAARSALARLEGGAS